MTSSDADQETGFEDLPPLTEAEEKELRTTRRLALVWALLGLVLIAVLCHLVSQAYGALGRSQDLARVGPLSQFQDGTIQTVFVNVNFRDPMTNKEFATLALNVVPEREGNFRVWFARSTYPLHGIQAPRACVVRWFEEVQRFEEPCGGSKWTRTGQLMQGPATRDLDQFPTLIRNDELWIELRLAVGVERE